MTFTWVTIQSFTPAKLILTTYWKKLTKQTISQIVIFVSSNDGNLQEFVKKPTEYHTLLSEKLKEFEEIRCE